MSTAVINLIRLSPQLGNQSVRGPSEFENSVHRVHWVLCGGFCRDQATLVLTKVEDLSRPNS